MFVAQPECVAAPPPILLHWRGPRRPRITDMLFLPSPSSSAGRQLAVADSGNECLLFYDVSGGVATVTQVLPVDPGPVPPPLNPERIGLSLISGGDAGEAGSECYFFVRYGSCVSFPVI